MNSYFDFVILGNGYKGKDAEKLFQADVDVAIEAILNTAPFSGRTDLIFHAKNIKQNLGCNDNTGLNEGVSCDTNKVIDAAKSVAAGAFTVNNIIILGNGLGHGGSDMAMIEFVGLGNHQRNEYCTFNQAAFYGKMMHEIGHTFLGAAHIEGTKMGSCTNGCCEIWNKPFNAEQQAIITSRINSAIT